ncbi:hypothetical protein ACVWYN_000945 [Pedobacter sp. UYP24]
MERLCLDCGTALFGRTDKKFCNDLCRTHYNNAAKLSEDKFLRLVNYTLRKNRRILKVVNESGKATVKMLTLIQRGFDFDYHTHRVRRNGKTYLFCYEYGYVPIGEDEVVLIIGKLNECRFI